MSDMWQSRALSTKAVTAEISPGMLGVDLIGRVVQQVGHALVSMALLGANSTTGTSELQQLFNDSPWRDITWIDSDGNKQRTYAAADPGKYFSVGLMAFLNVSRNDDSFDGNVWSRGKLEEADPKLHEFILRMFGDIKLPLSLRDFGVVADGRPIAEFTDERFLLFIDTLAGLANGYDTAL